MADRKFQIEVATSFNPAGTQQAEQGLNQVGKATAKAGEHTKEFNVHGREMRRLFGEIDRVAPGLGESLKGIFEPEVAGIVAVIVVVELLAKKFEDWKKKQEEAAASVAAVWIAIRDAINDSTKSADEFNASMQRAVDISADMKQNLADAEKILDEQVASHKKVLDAMEKEELAAAAGDKQKEEAGRRRFDDLKGEYDLTAESAKLEKQRDDLTQRRDVQRPKLNEAALQAEADLQEEIENRAAAEAKGRLEGKDENKLKAGATEAEERLPEAQLFLERQRRGFGENSVNAKNAEADLEVLHKSIADYQAYEKDKDTVERHTRTVEDLTKKKDAAVKVYTENEDAIKEETNAVKTGESVHNIHRASQARQEAFNRVDAAGGLANSDNIIAAGEAAISAYQHGQKLSEQQIEAITNLRALVQALGGNGVAFVNLTKDLIAHAKETKLIVAQLQQDVARLRSSASRNSPTGQ